MDNAHIPILGLAAYSGTGKTTLLIQLIPLLKAQGLRIGLIKHSHHSFEIDQPGKDSYELRQAGASPVMVVSRRRRAVIAEFVPEQEPGLNDQLKFFDQSAADLIIVEGFKTEKFPKIELYRAALGKALLYPNDPDIIAIASDPPLPTPAPIPELALNRPDVIAEFILFEFLPQYD